MPSKGGAGIIPAVFIGKVATTPKTYPEFPAGMQIAVPAVTVFCLTGKIHSRVRAKRTDEPRSPGEGKRRKSSHTG
jgi:hypothetical protein